MKNTLTAEEYLLVDPGHRLAYRPATETIPVVEKRDSRLSRLRRGQRVRPRRVLVQQHEPPKGLSEAALIRLLRQRMIGRPATYASIAATLLHREYVRRDAAGLLLPTGRGREACDFLIEQYPRLFDPGFTARLEEQLDAIAAGKARYRDVVQTVWNEIQAKGDRHAANDRSS